MARPFFKNIPLLVAFATSFTILLVGMGVATIFLQNIDEYLLIIHFDEFRGIDFLGTRADVFEILSLGIFLVLLNLVLAKALYSREKIFAYALASMSILVAGLILIAVGVIVSVNL